MRICNTRLSPSKHPISAMLMKLGICPIAVGDGIGEEDFDEEEEDEADDERDPAAEDAGSNKPRQRHPLPVWLAEAFKPRLPDANQRDANGLPKVCAVNQTCWFPQPSTYFLLQQPQLSLPLLYNPHLFLWDPAVLCLNGIPCPWCQHRLYCHCHISQPRRRVDFEATFWMIGYRYCCHNSSNPRTGKCMITFRSWDSRILGAIILKWMQSRSITFWLRCRAPEKQSFPSQARSFSSTHDHRSSVQSGMCAKFEEGC